MELKEQEVKLADWCNQKFKDAMVSKQPYTERWMAYLNAYTNVLYEEQSSASYKSNHASNLIFSTIESMRPIMFDNDPEFEAMPLTMAGAKYVAQINTALKAEWQREHMSKKMLANAIYTLVTGNSLFMLQWSAKPDKNHPDGNVVAIPVNPFNIFPDPLATSIEDAEYIIYATYMHVNLLKQIYPDRADLLDGGSIKYSELVADRDKDAKINNQVLVLEVYCRDYTQIEAEEEDGKTKKKAAYPTGRVIVCAPELSVVFEDKPNPYNSGRFPFFLFKDIDIPFKFWGEGEVRYLLSPQQYINELTNQIIDNAKMTANQIWIVDNNAGIPKGSLVNRAGLIIRKRPGSEVRREAAPPMPMYVGEQINSLKMELEVISGIHDVTRGEKPSGIQAGSAIMALQEAAQARIRLKVKLMEYNLGEMGTEWFRHMQQFWKYDRTFAVKKSVQYDPSGMPNKQPQMPGAMSTPQIPGQPGNQFDFVTVMPNEGLSNDYTIMIKGASTMEINRPALFDLMIRLAQTTADDGMPMVTRDAVLDFLPQVNKEQILGYFAQKQQMQMQMQQGMSANGQLTDIVGQMAGQMKGMNNDLGNLMSAKQAEDNKKAEEKVMAKGYDKGLAEGMALQDVQGQGSQELPPELMEQLAGASDEEIAMLLQQNPELLQQFQ